MAKREAMVELKRKACALEAVKMIDDHMVIGLGAGRNVERLIQEISQLLARGYSLRFVTSSMTTELQCRRLGFQLVPMHSIDHVDITFDGCGEIDHTLNASKAGGGIHTMEKILASLSKQYVILAERSKWVDAFTCPHAVSIEVVTEAVNYVMQCVRVLGGNPTIRYSTSSDGYSFTPHGNVVIDIVFAQIEDINHLNDQLLNLVGVVETSLFLGQVTRAILATDANHILTINRRE
jgi:ribose 5-phosphate isomerase A